MRIRLLAPALLVAAPLAAQTPAGALGFYRYPALTGGTIVFAAEGDLWTVPTAGGLARRLTSHPAEESEPVVSRDGRSVAFTARYEGPAEIYTMPIAGGRPERITWEAEASTPTAWAPDGRLIYATTHYATLPLPELVEVNPATGVRSRIPLTGATEGSYDASGRTLYFARPGFHRNVTKRYTGGTARRIWKYQTGAAEAVELTGDYRGESHSPMWWNGRVYFVTDRDGTMNVWSMTEAGGDARQHTRHSGWDVMHPSLDQGRIVYQCGADLWLYDIAADRATKLEITLATDLDQLRDRWVRDPMASLTSAHLSPAGDRLALTSRGRVFVAPVKQGRLVQASRQDSVRFRDVAFLPDGRSLVGLSDATGELEFVRLPANGVGSAERLTRNGTVLRFAGVPSPDGRYLAYDDNNNDLWVLELATGRERRVSENREGVSDRSWSPDGKWLAFTMTAANAFSQIKLFNVDDGRTVALTSDRVNSSDAVWDPKGDFLYFLSDRNLQTLVGAPWGNRQPEPYFDRSIEVYQVALRKGLRSPFQPDDELMTPAGRPDTSTVVRVDLDGLTRRIRKVPVPSGNYAWLAVNAEALFATSRTTGVGATTNLVAWKIGNDGGEAVTLAEGVRSPELSANGKKLLFRRGNTLHVADARAARIANLADTRVDLSGWSFPIDVRQDWRQIFVDAWRLERDYFYDPGLHGVDYRAMLSKYLPLVDRITTREELSELIGWAVGELSALHTSVRGGDTRTGPDAVQVASLGARLFRDPAAGGYRVDYVYQAEPDFPDEWSPLADPELDVQPGDVITAINGTPALGAAGLGELLRNQVGKQVLVTLKRGTASRDAIVTPIGNEANLRYTDWEYTRRIRTEEQGGGRIGYVHLRAMGGNDVEQWYRDFYPVFNRQGLIIDVRNNRGGNIDSFVLEKLLRKAWMYFKSRVGEPYWNMQGAFRGHLVVLVDQQTASDGEAFAEGFRRLGLGPVIGARTWGGEIWLSGVNTLSDGGIARAPMNGVYADGKWLIEQEGVIPDIEVDNLPHATFLGGDAQLDAAIGYLEKKIAEDPRTVPPPPPYPKKVFAYPNR
ncbi:MAG: S41 family peptidase [Gemmatimonadales bacterium]